jgi:hypothetical protein
MSRRTRLVVVAAALAALTACTSGTAETKATTTRAPSTSTSTTSSTSTTTSTVAPPTTAVGHTSYVVVWGDSLTSQSEEALRVEGRAHGMTVAPTAWVGLAPCDVAPQILTSLGELPRPDAIVLAFTGNNFSSCMQQDLRPLSDAVYYARYRRDVRSLVAAATSLGIPVVIAGAPAFPPSLNRPDRVELNSIYMQIASEYPGARYAATTTHVSPNGFSYYVPCVVGETAALGCQNGMILDRVESGVHLDPPHNVPCPSGHGLCHYTAGGHRFADAILTGLSEIHGLSYRSAPPTAGVPVVLTQ